jgi:predicted AlkP superfamily pyrophosphatase or phosphodiesterase
MASPRRTVVLNIVGLSNRHIGQHTPNILAYRDAGNQAFIDPAFPAVTCTAQSDYLTGQTSGTHGAVANGWYQRDLAEVQFWKQSNHLVQAQKVWEKLRQKHPHFTCAKLFWWYNMYSSANWSITPRPMYPADGRKLFDIHTHPNNIRTDIKCDLGEFPFPGFWGPAAGRDTPQGSADCASRWIAESAKWIEKKNSPTLSLVYLPHLDYNLQRLGPEAGPITTDLREIDDIVGELLAFYGRRGIQVMLLSEYGITEVNHAIHLNRLFREQGWLTIKMELGLEMLNADASRVFAVADHQVAHIYLNRTEKSSFRIEVQKFLEGIEGVQSVINSTTQKELGVDHERSGDLIAVAKENAWFTYYYWLNDERAPDFARTVDIHRKPGFDPVELFIDPQITFPKLRIACRLLQKKLGLRMLMDVVPLDSSLVKGSHGCRPSNRMDWPICIVPDLGKFEGDDLKSTDVFSLILHTVG